MHLRLIGIAVLAVGGFAACERGTKPVTTPTGRSKIPFTVSKETTAITEPLRADGTVDYVAALNQRHGKGVTPENNGFVLWLKVVGTGDSVLEPRTRDEFLRLCGAGQIPDGTVWESYETFIKRRHGVSDPDRVWQEVVAAANTLWNVPDHPDLVVFLQSQTTLLQTAAVAAERPRWWTPWVADGREAISALLPSLSMYREIGTILCARATLRAANADFDGFLADIRTVRRLARHIARQPTLLENLIGAAIEQLGMRAMAAVIAAGALSEKQCRDVAVCLAEYVPLQGIADVVDVQERWIWLDMIQWIAIGKGDQLKIGQMQGTLGMVRTIDHESINWDVVFKRLNGAVDETVQVVRTESSSELRTKNAAMAERSEMLFTQTLQGRTDLRRDKGETPAAYTERIANSLLALGLSTGKTEELLRKNGQVGLMMQVLLAAAEVRARTGKWPTTQEELIPTALKELPKDLYSEHEDKPFRYVLRAGGPWIYTVGDNGRDEGGMADDAGRDDLGIGAR